MTTYVEQDCTFTHEGMTFEAGGAVVTPEYAVGYVTNLDESQIHRNGCDITNWRGNKLGMGRVTARWETPGSYVSNYMHQVEATINGVKYTGRTQGNGMIWKGKRMAKQ